MCGEKKVVVFPDFPGQGSPPRMRGKGTRPPFLRNGAGITPAYAGKRGRKEVAPMSNRDHPRMCGEKPVSATAALYW